MVINNYGDMQEYFSTSDSIEHAFCLSIAAAYGFSILCMLVSVYVDVYAVALAIRGPEGSLDKAIHGYGKFCNFIVTLSLNRRIFFQVVNRTRNYLHEFNVICIFSGYFHCNYSLCVR